MSRVGTPQNPTITDHPVLTESYTTETWSQVYTHRDVSDSFKVNMIPENVLLEYDTYVVQLPITC